MTFLEFLKVVGFTPHKDQYPLISIFDRFSSIGYSKTSKGIFISSSYGVGKTVIVKLFEAFLEFENHSEIFRYVTPKSLLDEIDIFGSASKPEDGKQKINWSIFKRKNRNLFVDEFFELNENNMPRHNSIRDFDKVINFNSEFIIQRYDTNARTHFVSNQSLEYCLKNLPEISADRFRQMVAEFQFKGESKRGSEKFDIKKALLKLDGIKKTETGAKFLEILEIIDVKNCEINHLLLMTAMIVNKGIQEGYVFFTEKYKEQAKHLEKDLDKKALMYALCLKNQSFSLNK